MHLTEDYSSLNTTFILPIDIQHIDHECDKHEILLIIINT